MRSAVLASQAFIKIQKPVVGIQKKEKKNFFVMLDAGS
jgi:hypothetical protein